MRIAPHHSAKEADYSPRHLWPGETLIQWGGDGVVLGKNPYRTAFFEAFPDKGSSAGGFIRGEGKTIADAEDDAFAKFAKETACKHLWGREYYTNGGQLCRHCRAFRCHEIKSLVILGEWRKPIKWYEVDMMEGSSKYARLLQLRASLFGVAEKP